MPGLAGAGSWDGDLPRWSVVYGEEVPGRCPLCSLGCGTISFRDSSGKLKIEGDPDCPIAKGSLCARGAAVVKVNDIWEKQKPLYRRPGAVDWEEMSLDGILAKTGRRIKDLREIRMRSAKGRGNERNRFDSMAVITGGNLTNEQAYTTAKLFRSLGVVHMDTTVRASRGMAISGLIDSLGLPGPTHSADQIARSDVVVLLGSNPGLTSPVLARSLEEVRKRSGTVIILDPRRTETARPGDIWLNVRPGSDVAVLGAMISWVMEKGKLRLDELTGYTDANYMTVTESEGEYQRYSSGKNKGRLIRDNTLTEPFSVYQRLRKHYSRYSLERAAAIAGIDKVLLRRACRLLVRTGEQEFSACFVLGSGAVSGTSGAQLTRQVAILQTLLGNLKKRGGGIVMAAGAGNAQGVCDMGLLSPFLPGYLPLPTVGRDPLKHADSKEEGDAIQALARTWFARDGGSEAAALLPGRYEGEDLTVNGIVRAIAAEKIRALVVIGAEPLNSLPGGGHLREVMEKLDLLIVMDVDPGNTCNFWKNAKKGALSVKTEVVFIPVEPPALREGSVTDGSRRVRSLASAMKLPEGRTSLLAVLSALGGGIRSIYRQEKGKVPDPVEAMNWPFNITVEKTVAEINGIIDPSEYAPRFLASGNKWPEGAQCGNRLYRGWMTGDGWLAERRDPSDPFGKGFFGKWGWFWPWGVPDPFSHVYFDKTDRSVLLRWDEQGTTRLKARDVLPLRPHLPILFWKKVNKGTVFPEHYEPFHSPISDFLTGGISDPYVRLRDSSKEEWTYLFRRPERVLEQYPAILTFHRTGNIMGSGGVLSRVGWLAELGTARILEISPEFADELGVKDGSVVSVASPEDKIPVTAIAMVTSRIRDFIYAGVRYPVVSITLFGDGDRPANTLMTAIHNVSNGGMELKAFLVRVEKKK